MYKNEHNLKKIYFSFVIAMFCLGNTLPGINSTIQATTDKLVETQEDSNVPSSQPNDILNPIDSQNISTPEAHEEKEVVEESGEDKVTEQSEGTRTVKYSGVFGDVPWEITDIGFLNFYGGTFPNNYNENDTPWAPYRSEIKVINFVEKTSTSTQFSNAFRMIPATRIDHLSNFDTSRLTNTDGLFNALIGIKTLDISSLDFSNARIVDSMFRGMSSLQTLNVGSLITSKITSMKFTFADLKALESLNVDSFDTSNVLYMDNMFTNTTGLKTLNLDSFDTSSVTSMQGMFSGMTGLKTLNLDSFDTSSVTSMRNMFSGMTGLEALNLDSFDTSNVLYMDNMFSGMTGLKTLNLDSFDTSSVINMTAMFQDMSSLETLDISTFDTTKVVSRASLFAQDVKLKKINLGPKTQISNSRLPEIQSTEHYEGKWINIASGSADLPKGKNIWTSAEFMENYNGSTDADTYVWKLKGLEVETKIADIPLGTNICEIDSSQFIDSVKFGDTELTSDDYIIQIVNNPKTTQIGNVNLELKVILKEDETKSGEADAPANIVWGSTLVTKNTNLNGVLSSVSLLNKNMKPYLKATEGTGFSETNLTSNPELYVYRNHEEEVLHLDSGSGEIIPEDLMNQWNTAFEASQLEYGDVVKLQVHNDQGNNWNGKNTFISRNNVLVSETEGFDSAYYELTLNGYRLLHLNQFTINNNKHLPLNSTKEEINKNISEYVNYPEAVETPENYRIEFESIDTASSGNKKSTINVYEKLESGGEFMKSYDIHYVVDPAVTEHYYDTDKNIFAEPVSTSFTYGTSLSVSPEKYKEEDGVLYVYKGWSEEIPSVDNNQVQEGMPDDTMAEKDYYYIYEKADKLINVTIPTDIVFGTYEETKEISSKDYTIKNNSSDIDIRVDISKFNKVSSNIQLLGNQIPDPLLTEKSARLELVSGNNTVISGLNEEISEQEIAYIKSKKTEKITLTGTYFGDLREKNIVEYNMILKFKAQAGDE